MHTASSRYHLLRGVEEQFLHALVIEGLRECRLIVIEGNTLFLEDALPDELVELFDGVGMLRALLTGYLVLGFKILIFVCNALELVIDDLLVLGEQVFRRG